jgi:uncharacterized membrane protein
MYKYSRSPSAYDMQSSLIADIFGYGGFLILLAIIVFAPVFYFLLRKLKNNYKLIILTIVYMLICFEVNLGIFESRESAWSTYTNIEEIAYTFSDSYLVILITAVIFFLLNKKSSFK